MQVFTCTEFEGRWPVGVAAVIVARDPEHARKLLEEELRQIHLDPKSIGDIETFAMDKPRAEVLLNGDY